MKNFWAGFGVFAVILGLGLAMVPQTAEAAPPYLCSNYTDTPVRWGKGETCTDATQDLRVQLWALVNAACAQFPFSGSCGSGLVVDAPCFRNSEGQIQIDGHMSYRCRFYPDRAYGGAEDLGARASASAAEFVAQLAALEPLEGGATRQR